MKQNHGYTQDNRCFIKLMLQMSTQSIPRKSCFLCGSEFSLTRYVSVGGVEREFILRHVEKAPPDDALLCKKHIIEAKRNYAKPGFIPKPPQKHEMWLTKIRSVVSDRITNEEERVPTHTALWCHWLRSCWVSQMWQNSHLSDVYSSLPQPQSHGWTLSSDGVFSIDWEAPEVQEKINIEVLMKGCHCKTGCKSKVCGCRKKSRYCGPGCDCCTNLPSVSYPLDLERVEMTHKLTWTALLTAPLTKCKQKQKTSCL